MGHRWEPAILAKRTPWWVSQRVGKVVRPQGRKGRQGRLASRMGGRQGRLSSGIEATRIHSIESKGNTTIVNISYSLNTIEF